MLREYKDNAQFRDLLGKYFKHSRENHAQRYWTQEAVAAALSLSVKTVSRFESGETMGEQTLMKLLKFAKDEWGDDWETKFSEFQKAYPLGSNVVADSASLAPVSAKDELQLPTPGFRWLVAGLVAAVLATVLIIIGYFEITQRQTQRAEVEAQRELVEAQRAAMEQAAEQQRQYEAAEAERLQLEQEARELATPKLENLALTPVLQAMWARGDIRVSLRKLSGAPSGASVEMSKDGRIFRRVQSLTDFRPSDQFVVRLLSDQWSGPVGPIDFTKEARAAVEEALASATRPQHAGNFVKCFPAACEITLNSFCKGNWSHLTLGRMSSASERRFDFDDCPSDNMLRNICLVTPQYMFPMRPEQELFGALYDKDGERFDFSFETSGLRRAGMTMGEHIVELEPVTPPGLTPHARAWFEIKHGAHPQFRIELAAGSCRGANLALEDNFSVIYIDADGKGWQKTDLRQPTVPKPSQDTISVLFVLKDGREYGPFVYKFDADKVIEQRVENMGRPSELQCRTITDWKNRVTSHHECENPRTGYNILSWAKVDKVSYGFDRNNLSEVIDIDIGVGEIYQYFDRSGPYQSGIFSFDLPPNQNDLYFQYTYTDGTQTRVEYLDLR